MSAFGTLLVVLTILVVLAAVGAYLVNVPLWAVVGGALLALAVMVKVTVRRLRKGSPRQDAEGTRTH
jgi:hypothetical protein